MSDTPFPHLLDLLEEQHRQAGHAGSFQGCTLGDCPELRQELEQAEESLEDLGWLK